MVERWFATAVSSRADGPLVFYGDHLAEVTSLKERIATLEATPPAPQPIGSDTWQPAETAPKDGSEFIACNEGFQPFSCQFWREEFVHFEPEDGPIYYRFTHWIPLPARPKAGSDQ